MKRLVLLLAVSMTASFSLTAQVKMPQPSPLQTITQDFGIGKVELTYSRPSAKGRKVMGDLVSYGTMWRTGANAATTIRFTEPAFILDKKIDTGIYALYFVPGEKQWELVINKGIKNWGLDGYDAKDDVLRVTVDSRKTKSHVETMTFQFTEMKAQSCNLAFSWEKTEVIVPIRVDIREKIRAQIESALQTAEKKPYWQAAQFYNEYDKNLALALENVTKATEANQKAYWIWLYKAKIEKETGNTEAARASATKCRDLARDADNPDYVKMAEELLKEMK